MQKKPSGGTKMKERKVLRFFSIAFAALAFVLCAMIVLAFILPLRRAGGEASDNPITAIAHFIASAVLLLGVMKRRFDMLVPAAVALWGVAFITPMFHAFRVFYYDSYSSGVREHIETIPSIPLLIYGLIVITLAILGCVMQKRGKCGVGKAIYTLAALLLVIFNIDFNLLGYGGYVITVVLNDVYYILLDAVQVVPTVLFSLSLLAWAWSRRGKKLLMSPTDKLVALKEQADAGEITAEEYAAKKAEILSQL